MLAYVGVSVMKLGPDIDAMIVDTMRQDLGEVEPAVLVERAHVAWKNIDYMLL